ncbi:MAG: Crp/Fnr family transcriptional regulator [Elusimicrobiaceae bacterium]|nr:Crp/Fnr family transcriptional regulator [Elusimicrobiaceae bacterium]
MTVQYLKKVGFFRHLKPAELNRISSITSQVRVKTGELIFSKEDIGRSFFVVTAGKVKIFTGSPQNRNKTLAYMVEGDFFGEMALLGGKTRSASAEAVTDSELIIIDRQRFFQLIETDTSFTLCLLRTLSERLRKANQDIESLLFHNMLGRLSFTILRLTRERGIKKENNQINLSLHELADLLGTTREPLSRSLSVMKKAGILDYKEKKIIILDRKRLESMAPLYP